MAAARKNNYSSRCENDAFEELSAKLTADLRNHVRFMADYPVLSDDWIQMAEQIGRIGEITEMERQLPKAKDATLWECEEVALRYLLEDGKLNLCLRNLVEFNDYFKRLVERGPVKDSTMELLEKFEKGMGLTLKNAWLHAEAVQTTDLPLLIQYIHDVLNYCLEYPTYLSNKKMDNCQEVTVIYFLLGISKQLESMDESRIMPLVQEKRIFSLLAAHLSVNMNRLRMADISAGVETLALLSSTEDFQTHSDLYIDALETESALRSLKDDFLDAVTEDIDVRKRLRPLLDVIRKLQRSRNTAHGCHIRLVSVGRLAGGVDAMSDHEPTIYTFLLTIMCLALLVFTLLQLLRAVQNKNKLLAWSTCFYVLCLLWTVVRSTYWIMIQTRETMTYLELYLLYWFPTPIQFANFSLLILFYIQVITGKQWRTRWRNICLPLYFLLTLSMATFTAIWALNSSNDISYATEYGDEYDEEFSKITDVSVQLEYSAIAFSTLSFCFGFFGWKMANVESWKRRRLLISKPRSLAILNSLLSFIFFTRSVRDLATSQNWFLSIWNQLDMNGRVTTFAYFIFFCFWEFLPTVLLLCLITTKAGGVGAPRHVPASSHKLPDFGIFHIINVGADRAEGKLLASPLNSSYGTTASSTGVISQATEPPRWTHGGDLFQDPLRYDSDDGAGPSPRNFPNSFNSDSSTTAASYGRRSSLTSSFVPI
ncbi:hypothetical protein Poli38472_005701 [Pythium oligandrum]|uniref:Uncharacterized protein n=1 Tax=Pythium oligandrum TaxID=41045 RepID=A0A8K1CIH2_PYTOL|nr:hypothetical protein Poli38472_005701 [Pythium oligandrum]|eukprot:TMW63083.1 hypothetical protein Poli38472_005701 [Pythium oligandrum]